MILSGFDCRITAEAFRTAVARHPSLRLVDSFQQAGALIAYTTCYSGECLALVYYEATGIVEAIVPFRHSLSLVNCVLAELKARVESSP